MRRKSVAEESPELVPQWGTINDLSPDKVSSWSHKRSGGSVRKAIPGKQPLKTELLKVPAAHIVNTGLF